jgi:hypothetical protein
LISKYCGRSDETSVALTTSTIISAIRRMPGTFTLGLSSLGR